MNRREIRRNGDWETPEGKDFRWEHVQIEVLMDIREELQRIRRVMECSNTAAGFIAMKNIDKRLRKRLPLRPKVNP